MPGQHPAADEAGGDHGKLPEQAGLGDAFAHQLDDFMEQRGFGHRSVPFQNCGEKTVAAMQVRQHDEVRREA